MILPVLYAIIDFSCFTAQPDPITGMVRHAEELTAIGRSLGVRIMSPRRSS